MNVIRMEKSDLADVQALSLQLGYQVNIVDLSKRFDQITSEADYQLFVARDKYEKVIGWIQVNIEQKSLLVGRYAEIAALVVDENQRGKGVGKSLLQAAEKWAVEKKVDLIRLRSNLKRTDAHRFYSREGYEILKTSNIFAKKPKAVEEQSSRQT